MRISCGRVVSLPGSRTQCGRCGYKATVSAALVALEARRLETERRRARSFSNDVFAWPSLWILFGGGGVVVLYVMFLWLSPLFSVAAVNLRALLLGSYSQLSKSA